MTGNTLRWTLIGLGLLLLALVLNLPARQLAGWMGLPLFATQGTLWSGSARLQLGPEQLEHLSWRLRPNWPWQGPLAMTLQARHQGWEAQARVRLRISGAVEVIDAQASGPMSSPFIAQRLPIPLAGEVNIRVEDLIWRTGLLSLKKADIDLQNATLAYSPPLTLGELRAEATVAEGQLKAVLRDGGGPLAINGTIEGDAAGGINLLATLKARPGAPKALADALRLLPASPDGGARLQTRAPAPWLAAPTH